MKTDPVPRSRVRFGIFEADLHSGELRRDGLKVRLQELPFQVLMVLLERSGEVVTREDLRKRLWAADTFVDFEQGLNKAINKLREALGDDANNPRFVETLPRRGYRFIGPVEAMTGPQAGRRNTVRTLVFSAAVVVAVLAVLGILLALNVTGLRNRVLGLWTPPEIHSIAVLPFVNLSGDPEQEYFSDGMTDQLITELSKIGALRVIARTSVMRYKGTKKPLPEIAKELNVDAVVEASVLRSGNRVRINAQLVDASTQRNLWAQTYDRQLGDILSLHSEVARAIVRQIRTMVTPEEEKRLADARPVNPRAYNASLRGWYLWNKRTGEDMRKGVDCFEQAVKIDPNYAPAYAGIADSYVLLQLYESLPSATAYPNAKAAAQKAVTLDESLAEGHTSLAEILLSFEWDWPAAEKEFRRAIALNPNYSVAHHRYGWFLDYMGRREEALAEMKRAQELDPLSLIINTNVGSALYYRGEYDLAIKQWQNTLELDPTFPPLRWWLARGYFAKGLREDGLRQLELTAKLSNGNPSLLAELGYSYAQSGKTSEARRILAELHQKEKEGYVPPYRIAALYSAVGEKDQAIKHLEEAYQEHDWAMLFLNLERNTFFKSLRSDPRFQALLRRMNFPQENAATAE
jgi:TolB-like protein/DNA-binding winged helix-turn-helix (wHTH) protein/Tfp pilus assembly protein PilF